jgi:hypothetical protein
MGITILQELENLVVALEGIKILWKPEELQASSDFSLTNVAARAMQIYQAGLLTENCTREGTRT